MSEDMMKTTMDNMAKLYKGELSALDKFRAIDITDDGCDNCPHFCEERDPYNVGDSPTQYSCEGSWQECPRLSK